MACRLDVNFGTRSGTPELLSVADLIHCAILWSFVGAPPDQCGAVPELATAI